MRYRALDANGDYQFGQNDAQFFVDVPDAVAQALATRFDLRAGEWYLNLLEGTPYSSGILGENTAGSYDQIIKDRILNTQGVRQILDYSSSRDANRKLTVTAKVLTIYAQTPVVITLATAGQLGTFRLDVSALA